MVDRPGDEVGDDRLALVVGQRAQLVRPFPDLLGQVVHVDLAEAGDLVVGQVAAERGDAARSSRRTPLPSWWSAAMAPPAAVAPGGVTASSWPPAPWPPPRLGTTEAVTSPTRARAGTPVRAGDGRRTARSASHPKASDSASAAATTSSTEARVSGSPPARCPAGQARGAGQQPHGGDTDAETGRAQQPGLLRPPPEGERPGHEQLQPAHDEEEHAVRGLFVQMIGREGEVDDGRAQHGHRRHRASYVVHGGRAAGRPLARRCRRLGPIGHLGGAVMVVVTACSSPGADDVQRMLPAVMGRRHGCFDRRYSTRSIRARAPAVTCSKPIIPPIDGGTKRGGTATARPTTTSGTPSPSSSTASSSMTVEGRRPSRPVIPRHRRRSPAARWGPNRRRPPRPPRHR